VCFAFLSDWLVCRLRIWFGCSRLRSAFLHRFPFLFASFPIVAARSAQHPLGCAHFELVFGAGGSLPFRSDRLNRWIRYWFRVQTREDLLSRPDRSHRKERFDGPPLTPLPPDGSNTTQGTTREVSVQGVSSWFGFVTSRPTEAAGVFLAVAFQAFAPPPKELLGEHLKILDEPCYTCLDCARNCAGRSA